MHELAAVIVDTRRLSLYQVITEHLYYLPNYTKLYIFSSEDNRHLQEMLNCEFNVVEVNTIKCYNKLLKNKEFWNKIKEENVLIFQEDSRLLKEGIEDFYEWDYVGATWNFHPFVTQFHLGTLGYHAIEKWLSEEQCNQIKTQYESVIN